MSGEALLSNAPQRRAARFLIEASPGVADEFEGTISTADPLDRRWGIEILVHTAEAVDMARARNGLPLLLDHDPEKIIGRVVDIRLGDGRLRGTLRFGNGQLARDTLTDVRAGIRVDLSVGYEIQDYESGEGREILITRWQPFEVSIVAVPADPAAGIGRSKDFPFMTIESSRSDPPQALPPIATREEKQRRDDITALADLAGQRELGVDMILRGDSVETARSRLLDARSRGSDRPLVVPPAQSMGTGDRHLDHALQDFSLVRAIAGQVPDLRVDDGRERELSKEIAKRSGRQFQGMAVPASIFLKPVGHRVLTTALPGGGPGSNVIETMLDSGEYIDRLRAALKVRELGARIISGLRGNVDIPKMKASASVGWVAENAAISASDHQFQKVSLTPKHAGALTELSRNMLLQSTPDIEALVRDDFAKILAEAMDTAAIAGTGANNQPLGILSTSGIGDVAIGTNGGPITWDSVINLIGEVEIDNAEGTGFLTNAKVVRSARKTVKVSGQPVYVMEGRNQLAGYPLAQSNVVPSTLTKGTSTGVCSPLVFGNWSDLILAYWSEIDILVNPYEGTAYSKGNVQVRGMMTCDIAVRYPESFAAIKDLTTP